MSKERVAAVSKNVSVREVNRWVNHRVGRRATGFKKQLMDAEPEAMAMMDSGDWTKAAPIHFLIAHRVQHDLVYGASPPMGGEKTLHFIASKVREHFGGDPQAFALFLYWVWQREDERVTRLRSNNVPLQYGLTIRRIFYEELITGYRVHVADEAQRAGSAR